MELFNQDNFYPALLSNLKKIRLIVKRHDILHQTLLGIVIHDYAENKKQVVLK